MLFIEDNIIQDIIQQVVDKFLIPKFKELGLNATGEWLENLEVNAEKGVAVIRGREYSEQLAKGRKPNQDQSSKAKIKWAYGMANYNPEFKKWLIARGLTQYGIQIAYKIADKGTEIYQQGGTNLIELLSEPAIIEFINKKIANHITVTTQQRLQREIQEIFN